MTTPVPATEGVKIPEHMVEGDPTSPLILVDKRQELSFEKAIGGSVGGTRERAQSVEGGLFGFGLPDSRDLAVKRPRQVRTVTGVVRERERSAEIHRAAGIGGFQPTGQFEEVSLVPAGKPLVEKIRIRRLITFHQLTNRQAVDSKMN